MGIKRTIERVTGVWTGTYKGWDERRHGPRPRFWFVYRPGGSSWTRIEFGGRHHARYITWGHELTPGERVDNAMASVPTRGSMGRFRPL